MRDFLYLYVVVGAVVALILIIHSGVSPSLKESTPSYLAIDPTIERSLSSPSRLPKRDDSKVSKTLIDDLKHLQQSKSAEIDSSPISVSENPTLSTIATTIKATTSVITQQQKIQSAVVRTENAPSDTNPKTATSNAVTSVQPLKTKAEQEAEERRRRFMKNTEPWPDVKTVGMWSRGFWAGFRNQMMAFTAFVMRCGVENYTQILYTTIRHRDQYGTNRFIGFEEIFDVEHWNSYYPTLPRMVHCDQSIFTDFNCTKNKYFEDRVNSTNTTKPYAQSRQQNMFSQYMRYTKRTMKLFAEPVFPNPMDLAMTTGALKPHRDVQEIIDSAMRKLTQHDDEDSESKGDGSNLSFANSVIDGNPTTIPYMTLHARVEPDMQHHDKCVEKKVTNLTDILNFMYDVWPSPPVKYVFIPINRQYMEKFGVVNKKNISATDWLAVHNLNELNRIVDHGLWNGTVKVFEFGANALRGTKFENRSSIVGSMINFYIGLLGKIYIGNEVSSYAIDLLSNRFYRNLTENYKYLPDGLHHWTPPGTKYPQGFKC